MRAVTRYAPYGALTKEDIPLWTLTADRTRGLASSEIRDIFQSHAITTETQVDLEFGRKSRIQFASLGARAEYVYPGRKE